MRAPIAFVHGINGDGSKSIDLLCAEMERRGHLAVDVNYPEIRFWHPWSRGVQLDRAQYIVNQTHDGWNIVAFSAGCLLTRRAMQLNRHFSTAFLFAPADEVDTYYPLMGAERIHILYNPHDKAIRSGSLLPNHNFGELGLSGYAGPDDPRITDKAVQYYSRDNNRHGFFFDPDHLSATADFIEQRIRP